MISLFLHGWVANSVNGEPSTAFSGVDQANHWRKAEMAAMSTNREAEMATVSTKREAATASGKCGVILDDYISPISLSPWLALPRPRRRACSGHLPPSWTASQDFLRLDDLDCWTTHRWCDFHRLPAMVPPPSSLLSHRRVGPTYQPFSSSYFYVGKTLSYMGPSQQRMRKRRKNKDIWVFSLLT